MLEDYLDEFIDEEMMDEKASSTYNKYHKVISKFIDYFNKEDISKKDMIAYKNELVNKFSTKTVNNYVIIINKFIKFVELHELGDFDPTKAKKHVSEYRLKTIKEQEKTSIENVIKPIEYKRMLKRAKSNGDMETYMIMKVLAYTGIRVSELQSFTVESVKESKSKKLSRLLSSTPADSAALPDVFPAPFFSSASLFEKKASKETFTIFSSISPQIGRHVHKEF